MKNSEIITANYDSILDAIGTSYRDALEDKGRLQDDIYVWEDGQIEVWRQISGGSTWLVPHEWESRALVYVMSVCGFDWSDGLNGDETEDEITTYLDELAEQYLLNQVEIDLDARIEELKEEEENA